MPAQSSDSAAPPENVILSVAAAGNSRLPHSLAATEGPVAGAAPHLAVSRVIRGSWRALRPLGSERRVKILRPPSGARASLDRRCGGAQDDISSFFRMSLTTESAMTLFLISTHAQESPSRENPQYRRDHQEPLGPRDDQQRGRDRRRPV